MRNILTVGAYERDNFGDYLFYELLKRALPDDNLIPASVIYSDMRDEYGIITIPYDFALRNYPFDAVWVVGGEVGSISVPIALQMSLKGDQYWYYSTNSETSIATTLERMHGANRQNSRAYIPSVELYDYKSPLIINSVGLSFSEKSPELISTLTGAAYVGVRENRSYNWCKEQGIEANMSPDVVHSLPLYYNPRKKRGVGLVFQASARYMEANKLVLVEKALVETLKRIRVNELTIIAAGTANFHDSIEQYDTLAQKLRSYGIVVNTPNTRKPLEIVDYISSAALVVGTSLHLRIVASAYGVKRISLENEKLDHYAQQWDPEQPYSVQLVNLANTASELMSMDTVLKNDTATAMASSSLKDVIKLLPSKESVRIDKEDMFSRFYASVLDEAVASVHEYATKTYELEQRIEERQKQIDVLNKKFANLEHRYQQTLGQKISRKAHRVAAISRRASNKT